MKNIILTIMILATGSLSNATHFNRETKKDSVVFTRVLKQIIRNKPKIDKTLARELTASVIKHAELFKMDPYRAAAIAMQESSYGFKVNKNRDKSIDVGLFQINSRTAKSYRFDIKKLMTNIDYSVESYFKVMKDKNQMCKALKKDSWACYHSKTKNKRTVYKKLVNRYYVIY